MITTYIGKWTGDVITTYVQCASRYSLQKLVISPQSSHQKGMYFDGHERDDAVIYRKQFPHNFEILGKKPLTLDSSDMELGDGEKPAIQVCYDESTVYANANQAIYCASYCLACIAYYKRLWFDKPHSIKEYSIRRQVMVVHDKKSTYGPRYSITTI